MSDILLDRLETILEALSLIESRMASISSAEDFINTENGLLLMDGIAIRLQVIGENVKKIDQQFPEFLSSRGIDPQPIIRFRDFISHHYDVADYEVIYDICTRHLPVLKEKFKSSG